MGRENLPAFCQSALKSWEVLHPHWQIIILPDDNFRDHVCHRDIPLTFSSLKEQYCSDILRVTVVYRYGGAYLDMSVIIFKSLDGIWAAAKQGKLFLVSGASIDSVELVNNALIIAPEARNPILGDYLKRIIAYSE